MTVVLSPGLVTNPVAGESRVNPYVGWHNHVVLTNVIADSEAFGYPATNLANPSTVNSWLSESLSEQLVTVDDIDGQTDYVGIARHNLGSGDIAILAVEAITADLGADWEVVHPGFVPGDDAPILLRFPAGFYTGVRLRLAPDAVAPTIAVLFVGKLVVIPTGISPGYTPIVDGEDVDIVGGRAEAGDFLGEIVVGAELSTSTPLTLLPREWYDDEFRPFIKAANNGAPFFFAWSPVLRPEQVGYCWFDQSARPVISQTDGSYDISLSMKGVAL